jgi:hypothetical protein
VGFTKNGKLQGEWVLIVMVIKQPWQHMIMVRSPKMVLNDTVLSEVDYSNNQIVVKN